MEAKHRSILLIGESNVGKTHYGAQFLKRLIVQGCELEMNGAATNLRPFEDAMNCLAEGKATRHTAAGSYVESVWPIVDRQKRQAEMIWPDYGGEQIRDLTRNRVIPAPWRDRVSSASDWILVVRLNTVRQAEDIFTRPISSLGQQNPDAQAQRLSDQARLIELLQILLYVAGLGRETRLSVPGLSVLLSCWDELGLAAGTKPADVLKERVPMLFAFLQSTWEVPDIVGLSALEKSLTENDSDMAYATRGPEHFGYVILPDGSHSTDITLPVQRLLMA
ncbi:hypothetical protein AB3X91_33815 [Paraburkholderia sp. BR14263]|uniref:TRAFAC clade GTPase domain-containing protein n=1 Tax=unclassified Paraburkholderia TaxID=2615204 RepID=UPI0034D01D49